MESALISSSSSCSFLQHHPLFSPHTAVSRRLSASKIIASSSHRETNNGKGYYGGRLVDENMIVLRKRIHEMKMMERNYEPPSHWMQWEKRCYTRYDSIVCDVVALLQTFLMNTRPSVALGSLALLLISVPTSSAFLSFRLLDIAKDLLAAVHVG